MANFYILSVSDIPIQGTASEFCPDLNMREN